MASTIEDLKSWIERDITRFGTSTNYIEITGDSNPCYFFEFRFYTDNNQYKITAHNYPDERTYLGCIASNRKPRAGEDWHRGSDLADGDLSFDTWHRILGDIISYEMVKIHKDKGVSVDVSERKIFAVGVGNMPTDRIEKQIKKAILKNSMRKSGK